eukprot:gene13617-4512_t
MGSCVSSCFLPDAVNDLKLLAFKNPYFSGTVPCDVQSASTWLQAVCKRNPKFGCDITAAQVYDDGFIMKPAMIGFTTLHYSITNATYNQTKNVNEFNLDMDEAFIKPEFFNCGRTASCSGVFKSQDKGNYQTNTEDTPLEEGKSVTSSWEKIKQPTVSMESFSRNSMKEVCGVIDCES